MTTPNYILTNGIYRNINRTINVLWDSRTQNIYFASSKLYLLKCVKEKIMNSGILTNVETTLFPIEYTLDTSSNFKMNVQSSKTSFSVTGIIEEPPITELEKNYFNLVTHQTFAIDYILTKYTNTRISLCDTSDRMDFLYLLKFEEAKSFLANQENVDELTMHTKYPFLSVYSQQQDITFTEAAERIMLKNSMITSKLAMLDGSRMKYNALIFKCTSVEQINGVIDDFTNEWILYGSV